MDEGLYVGPVDGKGVVQGRGGGGGGKSDGERIRRWGTVAKGKKAGRRMCMRYGGSQGGLEGCAVL